MLSELKKRYVESPNRQIVGRTDEVEWLLRPTSSYIKGTRDFSVISLSGISGIGKTALLKQFILDSKPLLEDSATTIIYTNLSSEDLPSPLACLNSIFIAMGISAPLFEYALAILYSDKGLVVESDLDSGVYDNAPFFKALLSSSMGVARSTTPFSLSEVLFSCPQHHHFLPYKSVYAKTFATIDRMSDFELQLNLPCFLGMAVYDAYKKDQVGFIFIYDSYEQIKQGAAFEGKDHSTTWWLKEFIAASESGVHIISGRKSIDWHLEYAGWDEHLTLRHLQSLDRAIVNKFLSEIPIHDHHMIKSLCELSEGLPLYMDIIANYAYRLNNAKQEVCSITDLTGVPHDFLSHLNVAESQVIATCALLSSFDEALLSKIYTLFGLRAPSYDNLLINPHFKANRQLRFKPDAVIANHFKSNTPEGLALSLIGLLLNYSNELLNRCATLDSLDVFLQVLQVLAISKDVVSQRQHNDIMSVGVQLIECGFWRGIIDPVAAVSHADNHSSAYPSIKFLNALCLRKKGDLTSAINIYDDLIFDLSALGEWRTMIQYYHAHCLQMLNKYDEALSIYTCILNQKLTVKSLIAKKSMLLARRQIAEISAIRGCFVSAFDEVDCLLGANNTPIETMRLMRLKGDIYRFNFMFDEPYAAYEQAIVIAVKNDFGAMQIRLLINLAESACWNLPETALKHIAYASKLNAKEVVSCQGVRLATATAISMFSLKDFSVSSDLCEKIGLMAPIKSCSVTGLFSNQALFIISSNLADTSNFARLTDMKSQIDINQGAYQFLLDTALLFSGESGNPHAQSLAKKYQWLDFNSVINQHKLILSNKLSKLN